MEGKICNRSRGCKPETEEKYRPALELYTGSDLSIAEICRRCNISVGGFSRYISSYHRYLMLRRNGIDCTPSDAADIRLKQRRGQLPETRKRYREAIAACDSIEYIDCNISEIAREFGLEGANLARQLHTHYPEILEYRERARQRLEVNDNLLRGPRPQSTEQYAPAIELLTADRYITVKEAAELCDVSCIGLEQHLIFYHKELVENRIKIRRQAVKQRCSGKITGRGTLYAPSPATVKKYAEALEIYKTTSISAAKIAAGLGLSKKGFYNYLNTWHRDLSANRKPMSTDKYSVAVERLQEGEISIAAAAAEFRLNPESLRQYLKKYVPQLHQELGRDKTADGKTFSSKAMEKYGEAIRLYQSTSESLNSIAKRLGLTASSLSQFIKRHFPDLSIHKQDKT